MKGINRWFRHPYILMLIVFFLMCVYFLGTVHSSIELNEHRHASVVYDYNYHFAVDVGDMDSNLSGEFMRGAKDSASELGLALEIRNQNSSYNETSVDFITWATYVHPDGVITNQIVKPDGVKKLSQAGIPYCTVGNYPENEEAMYVGPDNYAQGYGLAEALAEKYGEKKLRIALMYDAEDGTGPRSRLQGFIDGAKQYPQLQVLEKRAVGPGVLRGMGVAEDIMLSFGEVNYFVCLDEVLLVSAVRGIIDLNRVNCVMASGIGYSELIENYIDSSIVDFAVHCDGYTMGREAVEKLSAYKQKKLQDTQMQTLISYGIAGDAA